MSLARLPGWLGMKNKKNTSQAASRDQPGAADQQLGSHHQAQSCQAAPTTTWLPATVSHFQSQIF